MKKHVKVYLDHFGYGIEDFIPCEMCGQKAVDIHHIEARGMGGTKTKDKIENLQALCRHCHMKFGDIQLYIDLLKETHNKILNGKGKF